ncbi:hypothetical protein GYA19_01240 [Candidatus Beckwithbacteria bacterium]|nr:hypothetical protein [Candidatus Beckwithbacteria bacterium]
MISRNLLLELKQILEEEFDLKLTLQEVTDIGAELLAFIETLLKIEAKYNYETKGGNHE